MLVFGLLFMFLIPPLQGGDEPNHLLRAYQLSEGNVVSEYVEKSTGGTLPTNLVRFSRMAVAAVRPGDKESKLTPNKLREMASLPDEHSRSTATFSNTAVYSPVAYAPQIVGIWIGRVFRAQPLTLMYLARLSGLVFAVLTISFAISKLPFGKLPFAVAALIPMGISQISVVTADVMVISLTFLTVAMVLHYAYRDQDLSKKNIAVLLALFVLICLTKPAMFPIAIISVLLVRNKAIDRRKVWKLVGVFMAAAVVTTLAWNGLIKDIASFGYSADIKGTSYDQQLHFVAHQPFTYLKVLYESYLTTKFNESVISFYGNFGWLDTPMPLFSVVIGLMVLCLSVFITTQYEGDRLPRWARLAALAGAVGIVIVGATSQYLFYVWVEYKYIFGLQGRYLLPPLLLLIVACLKGRKTFSKAHFTALSARCLQTSAVLLTIAVVVIFMRFFSV
jgi:uncharacterized membrane protein